MKRTLLTTIALLLLISTSSSIATQILWTELGGKIQKANADGTGSIETLYQVNRPRGIAVNTNNNQAYWTNDNLEILQSGSLNGSTPIENIVPGIGYASYGITMNTSQDKIYWTEGRYNRKIRSANLDGTNLIDIYTVNDGLDYPCGIALDEFNNKMYIAEFGRHSIIRCNMDGTGSWETLVTNLNGPTDISLDLNEQKMYWSLPYSGLIQKSNLDGSNIETVLDRTYAYQPEGIALDLIEQKIYYTDVYYDKIMRANLDGSNVETLFTGLSSPTKIAIIPEPATFSLLVLGAMLTVRKRRR